jgi:hypothetical protein
MSHLPTRPWPSLLLLAGSLPACEVGSGTVFLHLLNPNGFISDTDVAGKLKSLESQDLG